MRRYWPWYAATIGIAALVSSPVLAILASLGADTHGIWSHLFHTVLDDYIFNTLMLLVGVGVLTICLGSLCAWVVTIFDFPSVRVLQWALLLPLAIPANIVAYVYTDLLDFAGPVQSFLRAFLGENVWFPEIRTLPGAIMVLSIVLYPYVYMVTRVAFLTQSATMLDAGRTLGQGVWTRFLFIALPLARPAIIGGAALAMMETISDYGAVEFFGVPTFTVGIYRAWFGLGSLAAASQLAVCLLGFTIVLILIEQLARKQRRYSYFHKNYRPVSPIKTRLGASILLMIGCWSVILIGFFIPVSLLLLMNFQVGDPLWGPRFISFSLNSFSLAAVSSTVIVVIALFLIYGRRLIPSLSLRFMTRLASLGYAIPGSVIAIGIVFFFAFFDQTLKTLMTQLFGLSSGLVISGTIVSLVFAYLIRFLAIAFNTIEAGVATINLNLDDVARTLGHSPFQRWYAIHLPLLRRYAFSAFMVVFVDIMKELPATLILRPFNFETLALRVYRLASDERLAEASTAALILVGLGIIPVLILSKAISRIDH